MCWSMSKYRINTYVCGGINAELAKGAIVIKNVPTGHRTVVRVIDKGVPPFNIKCLHEGCFADARSEFFPDDAQDLEPTHELYRPDPPELKSMRRTDPVTWHRVAIRGGLLIREIVPQ